MTLLDFVLEIGCQHLWQATCQLTIANTRLPPIHGGLLVQNVQSTKFPTLGFRHQHLSLGSGKRYPWGVLFPLPKIWGVEKGPPLGLGSGKRTPWGVEKGPPQGVLFALPKLGPRGVFFHSPRGSFFHSPSMVWAFIIQVFATSLLQAGCWLSMCLEANCMQPACGMERSVKLNVKSVYMDHGCTGSKN